MSRECSHVTEARNYGTIPQAIRKVFMQDITRENLLKLIQGGMKREGLGVTALERGAGVPKDTIRDFLRGKTQILRADKLQKILRVLEPQPELTISGTVDKNAEILPVASPAEIVPCPPGLQPSQVRAIRMESDAMTPVFFSGWIIYYSRHDQETTATATKAGWKVPYAKAKIGSSTPYAEFLNKPCVVKLSDGRLMLRTLKLGSKKSRYHLISYNAPDIKDVTIEWAAKIVFIKTE